MNESLVKTSSALYVSMGDACEYGKLDVVIDLFKQGYNSYAHQHKAFVAAASHGHLPIIQYFLENHHAPVDAQNYHVYQWNVEYGNLSILSYLNEKYGMPKEIQHRLLIEAIKSHQTHTLEFIWNNSDFNQESFQLWNTQEQAWQNNNPFVEAVFYKNYEMMDFLIQQGADFACCEHEALKLSAQQNEVAMLEYLLHTYYLPTQQTQFAIDLIKNNTSEENYIEMEHFLNKLLLNQQLNSNLPQHTYLHQSKL